MTKIHSSLRTTFRKTLFAIEIDVSCSIYSVHDSTGDIPLLLDWDGVGDADGGGRLAGDRAPPPSLDFPLRRFFGSSSSFGMSRALQNRQHFNSLFNIFHFDFLKQIC